MRILLLNTILVLRYIVFPTVFQYGRDQFDMKKLKWDNEYWIVIQSSKLTVAAITHATESPLFATNLWASSNTLLPNFFCYLAPIMWYIWPISNTASVTLMHTTIALDEFEDEWSWPTFDLLFSSAVPTGSGAFQMPTHLSASILEGGGAGRGNLRNASVTFSLFWPLVLGLF